MTTETVDKESRLMTAGEVARLFRVQVAEVWRWRRAGKIVEIRTPGGGRRYPSDQFADVLSYLQTDSIPSCEGIAS